MIPRALHTFIMQLQAATEQNGLEWHEADDGAYFCEHKSHSLHISYYVDADREVSGFHFNLVNNSKRTPFTVRDDEDDYGVMRNLYEAVIANANKVEADLANFWD